MKLKNKIMTVIISVAIVASGTVCLNIKANSDNIYYAQLPNNYAENCEDYTYIDMNLQRFVNNLCKNDNTINPALLYSIAWKESFYTSNLKKVCDDNTVNYGIMQINEKRFDYLQQLTGLEVNEKTMLYSYTNFQCGYEILKSNAEYFKEQGFFDDELIYALILSYEKGVTKAYDMIKENITDETTEQIYNMYCFIVNNEDKLIRKE